MPIVFFSLSWFKESHHHLLDPLPNDPRFKHIGGGAILIQDVTQKDAGNYRYVMRYHNTYYTYVMRYYGYRYIGDTIEQT